MALRPGVRIIDPASMPIQKMPIEKLTEVVPKETPLGDMLDLLPDASLSGAASDHDRSDGAAAGLEQVIDLIGLPKSDPPDLI